MKKILVIVKNEPFRLFFPVGVICVLLGALVWIPQIWGASNYPVLLHRYLMLNGFTASFIAGFLMTAVPRFSKTEMAHLWEIGLFLSFTLIGLFFAFMEYENASYAFSLLQASIILIFLLGRITKRKENPPYSFIFIFAGIALWMVSAMTGIFTYSEAFKNLQYEGSIAAIILGVGSRLIPGILGHSEIVQSQKAHYETTKPFLRTIPLHFIIIIFLFVASYFVRESLGSYLRSIIVITIGFTYWKLFKFPKEKTSLTWNIWLSCWLIVLSFLLKSFWAEGFIHASHIFFTCGIVLLALLVGTRVLQSHGPKDKNLENLKILYFITFLIVFAGATRVSAFLMPDLYLRHLGYSSIILILAIIIWSFRYLRYIKLSNKLDL